MKFLSQYVYKPKKNKGGLRERFPSHPSSMLPESIATLPPFGPIEGQKWTDFQPMRVPEEPVCINLPAGQQPCPRQQENTGLAQRGVGGGGPASQLAWLQPFWLFCMGRLWIKVNAKSCNKSSDLIQKMKEVMGSLSRDTLHELQVQDRGSLYSWR